MSTEQIVTMVAAALAFVASAIATSVALYNARLAKFTQQKWWERKADAYSSIVEALAEIVYYHEEHLTAYEEGRNVPDEMKAEIEQHWRHGYGELKKSSVVGAFLISADAEAALRQMWQETESLVVALSGLTARWSRQRESRDREFALRLSACR